METTMSIQNGRPGLDMEFWIEVRRKEVLS